MLEKYPLDILRTVLSHIYDRADLKSLSEASRFWNTVTNPFLYRNIFISNRRNDYGIIKAHQRAGVLQYTKGHSNFMPGFPNWVGCFLF